MLWSHFGLTTIFFTINQPFAISQTLYFALSNYIFYGRIFYIIYLKMSTVKLC